MPAHDPFMLISPSLIASNSNVKLNTDIYSTATGLQSASVAHSVACEQRGRVSRGETKHLNVPAPVFGNCIRPLSHVQGQYSALLCNH